MDIDINMRVFVKSSHSQMHMAQLSDFQGQGIFYSVIPYDYACIQHIKIGKFFMFFKDNESLFTNFFNATFNDKSIFLNVEFIEGDLICLRCWSIPYVALNL